MGEENFWTSMIAIYIANFIFLFAFSILLERGPRKKDRENRKRREEYDSILQHLQTSFSVVTILTVAVLIVIGLYLAIIWLIQLV